jgi:sortase A
MAEAEARRPKAPKTPFSFRKHIVPPVIGVVVMATVFGLLNGEYLMARWRYQFTPRAVAAASVAAPPPTTAPAPKPDPSTPSELSIPTINVTAPIVFEPSVSEGNIQHALRNGVVHYATTSVPGQPGNVVIIGHSSGQPWAPGNYKWIFTLLQKVHPGDHLYVSYQGISYVYDVTDSIIVEPNDVSVLNPTTEPTLSLITCTPVGTSKHRLVVHARQVSPKPITATNKKPATKPASTKITLPGSDHSTSLWRSIRGWL